MFDHDYTLIRAGLMVHIDRKVLGGHVHLDAQLSTEGARRVGSGGERADVPGVRGDGIGGTLTGLGAGRSDPAPALSG